MQVIKDNRVIEDDWQILRDVAVDDSLPEGDIVVPLALWQARKEELGSRKPGKLGVLINGDVETEALVADLEHFGLIAIDFPAYRDGRGYSHARILRDHYGYTGDIRAVGEVLRDQLFFMQRCGFTSYCLPEGKDPHEALKSLSDFSVKYQAAADGVEPLYRKRQALPFRP